jgi:long-subunit fatty acid transport protein
MLNPSIAYKFNDWLSIGGGVGLLYGALARVSHQQR